MRSKLMLILTASVAVMLSIPQRKPFWHKARRP